MSDSIYRLENVAKVFATGSEKLTIFENLDLTVKAGESLAIIGASGSGKSTLLHLMGLLDSPSAGAIYFEGENLAKLTPDMQAHFRNRKLGFVFQFHHLLPEFTALENVIMPALIAGIGRSEALPRACELLEKTGMGERMRSRPGTLSGGERQRAAIARALMLKPQVILADEPTGNLDEQTGDRVGDLMLALNREYGTTLIVVTHNHDLSRKMDRALELRGGSLYEKTFK